MDNRAGLLFQYFVLSLSCLACRWGLLCQNFGCFKGLGLLLWWWKKCWSFPNLNVYPVALAGTAISGALRSATKGKQFSLPSLSVHSCLHFSSLLNFCFLPGHSWTLVFCFPQERKEFEERFSKEQGAMREQLQVTYPNTLINSSDGFVFRHPELCHSSTAM